MLIKHSMPTKVSVNRNTSTETLSKIGPGGWANRKILKFLGPDPRVINRAPPGRPRTCGVCSLGLQAGLRQNDFLPVVQIPVDQSPRPQ